MPETFEGKMQLVELKTKLDDHIATQNSDMNELKATTIRIETKLDVKADKSEVKRLDDRFWGVVIALIILLAGIIAAYYKK